MRIHGTEFVPIDLKILPLLQKWPVLGAVSHIILTFFSESVREQAHQRSVYNRSFQIITFLGA